MIYLWPFDVLGWIKSLCTKRQINAMNKEKFIPEWKVFNQI